MKPRILARLNEKKTELLTKAPLVELTGQSRVLIENHFGVLAYSTQEVQIKVSYGKLSIAGQKLQLLQLSADQLVIFGSIETLRLMGGKE